MGLTLELALFMGVLQGLTEFLPISSSGHLALFGAWFGLSEPDITFDVLVHMGTLAAIVIYFRKDLWQIVKLLLRGDSGDMPRRIVWYLIAATVPAGLVGVFLKDYIEVVHHHPQWVGVLLIANAGILFYGLRHCHNSEPFWEMTWKQVLIIGCAQAFAILPGISRSGITIIVGLSLGMDKMAAARFSFLMAIPAIGGAGVLTGLKLLDNAPDPSLWLAYSGGLITSVISGFIALVFLVRLLEGKRFFHFGYYCLPLGLLAIIF